MNIAIIGGGISGLATALALQRLGRHTITVYEQTREIKEVGAGLTIWPNAVRALQQIGLAADHLGMPANYRTIRTWQGTLLSQIHVDELAGSPLRLMHRADLQQTLLDAAIQAGVSIELGARCIGIQQDEQQVTLQFSGDRPVGKADILIGADGIRSVVRSQLFGAPQIHYTGYTSWRGIAQVEEQHIPQGISSETWGIGKRIGLIPLGEGRMYWFAAQTTPSGGGKNKTPEQQKHLIQELFHGWHAPIEPILAATPADGIIRTDVFDIEALERWTDGRVVLVGDAAHAMSPNMGQGGCQALEDAPALAQSFQRYGDDYTAALRSYEMVRKPRARRVALNSRRIGKISQVSNRMLYPVRNVLVRSFYTQALSKELIWLLRA